jgi:nucleoside-diphosphate-sugar epimerase
LGRWFCQHHLARGDDVVGVDDFSNQYAHWPERDPRWTGSWDWQQREATEFLRGAHPRGYDLVYQFAAPVGGRLKIDGDPLFNSGSLAIDSAFFRWAIDHVETVVYPSSSAVYPAHMQTRDADIAEGLKELQFEAEGWMAEPDQMYGFGRLVGEYLARKAAGYGLNTLCIRPFSGYGEDQSLDYPVPSIARRVAERQDPLVIWGSGDQRRDFVHVLDIVGATQARLDAGVEGYQTMNIGSGHATSFRELAQTLCSIEGYRPEIATDESKPGGVFYRYANIERMSRFYTPRITFGDGMRRVLTYQKAAIPA